MSRCFCSPPARALNLPNATRSRVRFSRSDTPEVLAAHAARLKVDPTVWTFLTGDRVTIDRFAAKFGVSVARPPEGWNITHNLRTALVGADGRIVTFYSGGDWTPAQVLTDLRTALKLSR